MNATLGARLGTKHQAPSLDKDLVTLHNSLQEHNVFNIENGRALRNMKNLVMPNVITLGLNQLAAPLADYNQSFQQLQKRRIEDPLTDEPTSPSLPDSPNSSSSESSSAMSVQLPQPPLMVPSLTIDVQVMSVLLRACWVILY